MAGGGVGVGVYEAAGGGIVISALQIIEPGIVVVAVATTAWEITLYWCYYEKKLPLWAGAKLPTKHYSIYQYNP